MKRVFSIFLICILLAGCGAAPAAEPAVAPTTIPETVATEMTLPAESGLLDDEVHGKVCVGIMPTEAGRWQYVVIEDQEAAAAAFEKARSAIYSNECWVKGDKTVGMMVCYNGEFWDFLLSGELVSGLGRIRAEDAAPLLELCFAAAVEAGWREGLEPMEITGITAASLRQGETEITLTNPAALDTLEAMLSAGKFSLGGTGCPFNALLTMEREEGDPITIALATDSCGVWMSQGYFYEYANDSQSLFDLFGVTFEAGKIKQ